MVRPGFRKDGIVVSQIGIKMYVTIPALGVQVMFSGLIFSVELPFSKFANNTEGQCGERPAQPRSGPPHSGPFLWPGVSGVRRVGLGCVPPGTAFLAGGEAARVARSLQVILLSSCTKNVRHTAQGPGHVAHT